MRIQYRFVQKRYRRKSGKPDILGIVTRGYSLVSGGSESFAHVMPEGIGVCHACRVKGFADHVCGKCGQELQTPRLLYPVRDKDYTSDGFIESEWGVSENNRQAKFYKLTRKGRREMDAESDSWARLSTAVARVLEAIEQGA